MTPAGSGTAGFPRTFGKYTLLKHLAVGGMADVFLAQHKGPAGFEKECVIKRILPHLGADQEFVQMFLDEARLSARLSHPNIVQIFDLGQVDGHYFLAMEFVDGVNLEQLLEAARHHGQVGVPWQIALRVVADVAAGLDHAHNIKDSLGRPLQLVHRDVSPSNIMTSWGGAAKVLDFGIAKAIPSSVKKSRTEVGTIKGKIPYMSPEQLQGFSLDGRSDVFSLGVILYEVTTGGRPFPADNAGPLTMQILHDQPTLPSLLVDGYPKGMEAILMRALAKQPEDRWQSAREFELALEGFLSEQHISCSAYDVEAYLRELMPDGKRPRITRQQVSGTDQTEVSLPSVGRVATPLSADDDPPGRHESKEIMRGKRRNDGDKVSLVTGLNQGPEGHLGDLGDKLDDLEHEDEVRRRRRGGGGMMVVIVLLVAATAGGLLYLRERVMDKERADHPAAAADLGTGQGAQGAADAGAAAAAPDLRAPPDLALARPDAAHVRKPGREVKEAKEVKETQRPPKGETPRPRHAPKPPEADPEVKLPRLPDPPPEE